MTTQLHNDIMLLNTKPKGSDNLKKKLRHEPYNKLRGVLREKNLTYKDVADTLDISETAVQFKINGISDFYLSEVEKLQQAYGFELNIFLT